VRSALLYQLVDRAPKETPREVALQLDELNEQNLRRSMPHGAIIYAAPAVLLFYPLALWMGTKNLTLTSIAVFPYLLAGALFYGSYRMNRMGRSMHILIPVVSVCVAFASVLVGPFFFVPALATINAAVFCAVAPHINRAYIISLQCLSVLVPAALEWFGIGPATHEFLADGSMRITSVGVMLPRIPTMALFISSSIFTIVAGGLFLAGFSDAMRAADAKRLTQRWQIEQLLPQEARLSQHTQNTNEH
jgi:hypothetical protein